MDYKLFEGNNHDYGWLLEHMIPPDEETKGCKVRIPDLIYFGKPKTSDQKFNFIGIRTDKEGLLTSNTTNFTKMTFHQLRLYLTTLYKAKIKEDFNRTNVTAKSLGKTMESSKLVSIPLKSIDKQMYYRDVAIMRFWEKTSQSQDQPKSDLNVVPQVEKRVKNRL